MDIPSPDNNRVLPEQEELKINASPPLTLRDQHFKFVLRISAPGQLYASDGSRSESTPKHNYRLCFIPFRRCIMKQLLNRNSSEGLMMAALEWTCPSPILVTNHSFPRRNNSP